jgi:hypothetical protein
MSMTAHASTVNRFPTAVNGVWFDFFAMWSIEARRPLPSTRIP